MTRHTLRTTAQIVGAVVAGIGLFFAVGYTASLPSARPVELAWFWLSAACVAICGRLVYLTWCRFWRREKAGYNGVSRRLTLGYLWLYCLLGAASVFATAVGGMTLLTPSGGVDPATPLEAWAMETGRAVNVLLLLAMMACIFVLIARAGWEEERLRIYFDRNDKETQP